MNGTKAGVSKRCVCSMAWRLEGPGCDEPRDGTLISTGCFIFGSLLLLHFVLGLSSAHYSFWGYKSTAPSKATKSKWNASNVAAVFLTGACFSECFRWTALFLRNGGHVPEKTYHAMLFGVVVSMQCVVQCLLTVCIAWIDVADNASQKMSSGGSGGGIFSSKCLKIFLKSMMVFILVFTIFLQVSINESLTVLVALFAQLVTIISLGVGGYKLRRLLRLAGTEGPNLPWLIKRTNIGMAGAFVVNLFCILLYTGYNGKLVKTGSRDGTEYGVMLSFGGLGYGIFTLLLTINRFVADTNLKKINKFRGSSVAPDKKNMKSTTVERSVKE